MSVITINNVDDAMSIISSKCIKEVGLSNMDELYQTYYRKNPDEIKSFKNNLQIALHKNLEPIQKLFETNNRSDQMRFVKSIIKIIQYGSDINYSHIYFEYKTKTLEVQYQAKLKILQNNGFKINCIDYILINEIGSGGIKKNEIGKIIGIDHNINLKERSELPSIKEKKNSEIFFKQCIGGYVSYTYNNEDCIFLLERDSFQAAYENSSTRAKYTNHNGLNITLTHRLFDFLILKDWTNDDYENEQTKLDEQKLVKQNATQEAIEIKYTETELLQLNNYVMQINACEDLTNLIKIAKDIKENATLNIRPQLNTIYTKRKNDIGNNKITTQTDNIVKVADINAEVDDNGEILESITNENFITGIQCKELKDLLQIANSDIEKMLSYYKIQDLKELPQDSFEDLKLSLENKIKKQNEANKM